MLKPLSIDPVIYDKLASSPIYRPELWTPQGMRGVHCPETIKYVGEDLLAKRIRTFGNEIVSAVFDDQICVRYKVASLDKLELPEEIAHLQPHIEFVLGIESALDPCFEQAYVHLDVRQTYVHKGDVQYGPAVRPHIDGFGVPGARKIRQYIVLDGNEPTIFFTQDIDIDDTVEQLDAFSRENINQLFENHIDKQLDHDNVWIPDRLQLFVSDGFCIHRAPVTLTDGIRTFVRLTFCAVPHPGLDYI